MSRSHQDLPILRIVVATILALVIGVQTLAAPLQALAHASEMRLALALGEICAPGGSPSADPARPAPVRHGDASTCLIACAAAGPAPCALDATTMARAPLLVAGERIVALQHPATRSAERFSPFFARGPPALS